MTLSDSSYARLAALLHATIGLALGDRRQPMVASRLATRAQRLGLARIDDYVALIERDADGAEFQVAVDLLTTNETYFFREPAHFELLERELERSRPRAFAAWSAASSGGDEAYSIAMVLADLQAAGRIGADWSILGTDVSDRVLRAAVRGVYPEERLRNVSRERLRRHCLRGEGESEGLAQVGPALRRNVRFGRLNLCRDFEPLGPFDAVFLRNVLIYFDPPTKRAVVDRVVARLRPGGLFFVGTAEGRAPCSTPLEPIGVGAFRKPAR